MHPARRSLLSLSGLTLLALFLVAAPVATILARQAAPPPGAAGTPEKPRDSWVIVHCGTLLAVPGQAPLKGATVVVKNGRVDAVLEGYTDRVKAAPGVGEADVRTIDLKDRYVLPGLIDCHVHMTHEFSADTRLRTVTDSDADAAINGVLFAKRTLEAGFTTVRDVRAQGDACFALRDAITAGKVMGPRILAAGHSITPTGGHADGTNGYRDDLFAVPTPIQGIADGADACRQAVRNQVKRGADVIKLTATGGVLSNTGAGLEQQFFEDELKAIVDTAHLLSRRVAAHAHGVRGINAALRAGVDSIEHGTYLDEESIKLFKEKGAYYVPTIIAGKTVSEYAAFPNYYAAAVAEKARQIGPVIQGAFTKAYKGGVKIAFGTDAGVYPHGNNARELQYMVEGGMPAGEAIVSATLTAAELIDLSKEIGTIEKGKAADMIGVAKDPTGDITELQRVLFVMKSGGVAKDVKPAVR